MAKDLDKLSLLDILPSSITGDANVQATAHSLDPEIQSVSRDIREALIISRIEELSEPIVDLLAWQLHVDFYEPDFPLAIKRRLVKNSIPMHRKKGTKWAVEEILRALRVEAKVSEWFEYGGAPYTFRVNGLLLHPLHPCESWGTETYSRVRAAIIEMKNARSWLERLILKVVFDFGSITPRLRHTLRRELRTARAFWSLWPRFDFVDADAMPLDWNPWSALRRELRTARASRGLTGVSHLDRLLRFDSIDADFLPMDIAMPYFEADTPPILVPFRWRVHRTARGSATFEASGTQGIAHRRRAFAGAALGFSGMFSGSRMAMGSPSEAPCGLDRYVGFDGIPADFAPLDCAIPYREGERRWGAT